MKMEKISENQVRFTLNKSDLLEREIKISELAYGSEKAQELFRDMMEKAFDEYGFDADNIPLMIEAVPLSNESIMIIVTKVEEPDELEEKIANYSPNKNIRKFTKREKKEENETEIKSDKKEKKEKVKKQPKLNIYKFKKLDDVINASCHITLSDDLNTLYKHPNKKKYFLVINNPLASENMNNVLLEYGEKINSSILLEGYLREHSEIIIKDTALQVLKTI